MPHAATGRVLPSLLIPLAVAGEAASAEYFVDSQAEYAALNQTVFNPGDGIFLRGGMTFNGGLFFDEQDSGNDATGRLIDPIRLTSFGGGRATINAGDGFGVYAQDNGGFRFSNFNVRGSGVAADGSTANTGDGVSFFTAAGGDRKQDHIHLDNLDISGFGGTGLSIGGFNGDAGYNGVRVTNVAAHGNRRAGIATFGDTSVTSRNALTDVYIGDSRAYNNVGDPGSVGNTGSGIVLGGVNGGVIERSVAHDNGRNNRPSEGPVGVWAYDSQNVTIQFNESYGNRTRNGDGGGFDLDQNVTDSVVQYNYSHGNAGAGFLVFDGDGAATETARNTVRYNVSENDGRSGNAAAAGITIGGNVADLRVYGNTVFITDAAGLVNGATIEPAIKIDAFGTPGPRGVLIANNAFTTDGGGRLVFKGSGVTDSTDPDAGVRFLNNNYFAADGAFNLRWNNTTYTSLEGWLAAIDGQERLNVDGDAAAEVLALNVDPLFADPGNGGTVGDPDALARLLAYRLRGGSPLIDAGLDLEGLLGVDPGSRDFSGNPLPVGPGLDVGAVEVPEPAAPALIAAAAAVLARRRRA